MNCIPLWPEGAPLARGKQPQDIPTLTAYWPDPAKASGAGMVLLPGGGYEMLSDHEGADFARWLASHGIAGLVVKYRLGTDGYCHPAMLQDAARAMRLVRAKIRSGEWSLDPQRIGIMGASAGGHLAATLMTHFDAGDTDHVDPVERESSRPDLGVLCYAVISLLEYVHQGSRRHLLGEHPRPELLTALSADQQVRPDTPPCFIWHTLEDSKVPVENALRYAVALRQHQIPFELHVYEKGEHCLGPDGALQHRWTRDVIAWLHERGYCACE